MKKKPITTQRAYTEAEPHHLTLDELTARVRDGEHVLATCTLQSAGRQARVTITDADVELTGGPGVRVYAHGKGWDLRGRDGAILPALTDLTWRHATTTKAAR